MYSFGIKISSLYFKLAFFKYKPHDIVEKKKIFLWKLSSYHVNN